MTLEQYVFDTPLPEYLNVALLKERGLEYIREMSGPNWTHLNESDSGVMILNQLCYALSELGYCIDFPMQDILTREDGLIDYRSQFFLPEEILTCSPVTSVDYAKLILDAFPQVKNVQIRPISKKFPNQETCKNSTENFSTGIYQVDLLLDLPMATNAKEELEKKEKKERKERKELTTAVYYFLNRSRNVGELFLKPRILKPLIFSLRGEITLDGNANATQVLEQIRFNIANYLWPKVRRYGYKELERKGESINSIFNGPRLKNGWMETSELEPEAETPQAPRETSKFSRKRNFISLMEIALVLRKTKGVKSINNLSLRKKLTEVKDGEKIDVNPDKSAYTEVKDGEIEVNPDQAAYWETPDYSLEFYKNNMKVEPRAPDQGIAVPGDFPASNSMESIGATLDITPPLPKGKYREIEDYYSIQNTFPETYALGNNSPDENATEYRKAQSKQLRGYLMVFDQLLANEFSQLAHVGQLFSFKQSATSSMPLWLGNKPSPYPVPYQKFSPTYFFQTLYGIPYIRCILAGNEMFEYPFQSGTSSAELREEAWRKYKNYPFNQYRHGLSLCMEENEEAENRRNRMLDHLLARHGESAAFYDEAVLTPRWAGSLNKTRIITKGIYLQNYQLLSYKRQKGYDFLSAKPIGQYKLPLWTQPESDPIPKAVLHRLLPIKNEVYDLYVDFQIDMEKLEKLQALRQEDFTNFSTFELKLNILLGLRQHYYLLAFVLEVILYAVDKERKLRAEFTKWLREEWPREKWPREEDPEPFELKEFDITIKRVNLSLGSGEKKKAHRIFLGVQKLLEIVVEEKTPEEKNQLDLDHIKHLYLKHIQQLLWLADERKGFILLETVLLLQSAGLKLNEPTGEKPTIEIEKEKAFDLDNEEFFLNALMIFPDYVFLVNSDCFKNRLDALADEHWPAHVSYEYRKLSFEQLGKVISCFRKWHNEMRYQKGQEGSMTTYSSLEYAKELAELLGLSKAHD